MSLLNNSLRGNVVAGLAIGVGALLVVPVAVRALSRILRPVAEGAITGGAFLYEKGMEVAAGTWDSVSHMMAEAHSEISASKAPAAQAVGTAVALQAEAGTLAPAKTRVRIRKPGKMAEKKEGKKTPGKKTRKS